MERHGSKEKISTHALTWSATSDKKNAGKIRKFQLTHSRGVRLDFGIKELSQKISTHALTWSATTNRKCRIENSKISTHALTWSATFYSLPRQLSVRISTHALTWSATCKMEKYVMG